MRDLELGDWYICLTELGRLRSKKQTPVISSVVSDRDGTPLRDLKEVSRGRVCATIPGNSILEACQLHQRFEPTSFSERGIKIFCSAALLSRNTISSSLFLKDHWASLSKARLLFNTVLRIHCQNRGPGVDILAEVGINRPA